MPSFILFYIIINQVLKLKYSYFLVHSDYYLFIYIYICGIKSAFVNVKEKATRT